MGADRRCGMRADEVAVEPVAEQPVRRTRFYALAAAACIALAFVAARLPRIAAPSPAAVLVADAGDLLKASAVQPGWPDGELSGGTP
jgi:hypothetical protein